MSQSCQITTCQPTKALASSHTGHTEREMNEAELTYLVLTAFDQESGQRHTSSQALELVARLQDPSAVRDYKQRTLLHHACWNGWYDVAKILVEKYGCDPNATDDVESTPLHWACHSSAEIVKYLVLNQRCDPSCRNRYGSTPLHWACRSKRPDIEMIRFLVEDQRCDPSAVELGGNTPLHFACTTGSLEIVKFLLKDSRCEVSCRNDRGETLLHKASHEGHYELVKYLVMERGCNASPKDKDKETPLHMASAGGHLDIVQFFCLEQRCDPDCKTSSEDWTPLHKACAEGHVSVVRFLVNSCKCSALKTNRKSESPFTLACIYEHIDVVVFLLTIIDLDKAPGTVSRILGSDVVQGVLACKQNHPLRPAFKLFVVGNPSAGKSTLVKTLQNKLLNTTLIKSVGAQFSNVKGVELKTAGIIPVHVENSKEGHIIMYDFAGQHEYYSSHAAVMETLASAPGSLVMIVVDLSRDKDEITHCLNYWSSFIRNLSGQGPNKPQLAIVGSHADVVKACGDQPSVKLSNVCKELDDLSATAKVALNCKRLASTGLNVLFDLISSHAKKFQKRFDLDLQAYFVNAVIKQNLSDTIACHFSDIAKLTALDENAHLRRHDLIPETDADLARHLTTLSEHGQLLFLKNGQDIAKSWVILNKEVLLSEINGILFAPAYFKQHHDVATDSGIVPYSKLKAVFPTYDVSMIVSFLEHLEFCHKVSNAEAAIIDGERFESESLKPEMYYYFAKLVKSSRPEGVSKSIESSHYRCGWYLYRKHNHQFLMCRFNHILMLRLALNFGLVDQPVYGGMGKRRFIVWKNGIYWENLDEVEVIVESIDTNQGVMVMLGCPQGKEIQCMQLRSDIIRMIFEAKEQFSAAVEMTENFVHPIDSQLALHPLKLPQALPLSSISKAIENDTQIIDCSEFNHDSRGVGGGGGKVEIANLLHFEPYACLSADIVRRLFNPATANLELSDSFLAKIACIAYPWTSHFQKALQVTNEAISRVQSLQPIDAVPLSSPSSSGKFTTTSSSSHSDPVHPVMYEGHPVSDCLRMLRAWKNTAISPTHQSLRDSLDGCSVYAGRSPLVSIMCVRTCTAAY